MAIVDIPAKQLSIPTELSALFDWEYEVEDMSLGSLYEKAKRDQWNATSQFDWDVEVDKGKDILPIEYSPIHGTSLYEAMSDDQRDELSYKAACWRLSQFLHGEQGALLVSAQLVNAVPDYESKMCASAQTIDEARHVETFKRYIEKVDRVYTIDPTLEGLLKETLQAEMWQKKFIGMQVVIEGLALAAFKMMKMATNDPLLRDALTYIMKDESRHVGFGYLALKKSINGLTERERRELEDFAYMACSTMVTKKNAAGEWEDGFLSVNDVYEEVGIDPQEMNDIWMGSEEDVNFNKFLFTDNIIPALDHLGLFTDKIRTEYEGLGVIDKGDEVADISEDVTMS